MTRHKPQMTLDAWDEQQQNIGDWSDEEEAEAAALVDELEQPEPRTVTSGRPVVTRRPRDVSDDTTPAVAPRGALGLLRTMETAA